MPAKRREQEQRSNVPRFTRASAEDEFGGERARSPEIDGEGEGEGERERAKRGSRGGRAADEEGNRPTELFHS